MEECRIAWSLHSKHLFGRSILNFLNTSLKKNFFNTGHYSNDLLLDVKYSFAVCLISPEYKYTLHDWMEISKVN
jgi:hypothetical protein